MTPIEFYARAERVGACLLWRGAIKSNGYGNIGFGGRTWSTHRLSYTFAHGAIPDGASVLHSCDVRACIEPSHLHAGSRRLNSREMVQRGRYAGPARLSPQQRAEVLQLAEAGVSQRKIAQQFGVSQGTVSNIVTGKHTALGDARWAQRLDTAA